MTAAADKHPGAEDAPRPLLRHRLEYAGLRVLEALLRALGPDRASAATGWIWRQVAPLTRRHRTALAHLRLAFPEKSEAQREAIARAAWENLGRTMAESLMSDRIVHDDARMRLKTPEVMGLLEAHGGRVVIASLHYANWEIAAWPATRAGYATMGVYQRVQNPLVDAHVVKLRSLVFPGGMLSKGHGTPRRLIAGVKSGKPLCVLADQREMKGAAVPFFGHPAPSIPLPAFVARSFGLPLIAARGVRRGGVNFEIEGIEVPVPHTDDREADIVAATAALQAVFEGWIREDPTQWMWAHRRWGRDVPGLEPPTNGEVSAAEETP